MGFPKTQANFLTLTLINDQMNIITSIVEAITLNVPMSGHEQTTIKHDAKEWYETQMEKQTGFGKFAKKHLEQWYAKALTAVLFLVLQKWIKDMLHSVRHDEFEEDDTL